MSTIVLNVAAITAAATALGVKGDVEEWLGISWLAPVTPYVIAVVLAHLPMTANSAFNIETKD